MRHFLGRSLIQLSDAELLDAYLSDAADALSQEDDGSAKRSAAFIRSEILMRMGPVSFDSAKKIIINDLMRQRELLETAIKTIEAVQAMRSPRTEPVAQSVEQAPFKSEVEGSNPSGFTNRNRLWPDAELGAPVKTFSETFSAETLLLEEMAKGPSNKQEPET